MRNEESSLLRPTLLREIGAVYIGLAVLGICACGAVLAGAPAGVFYAIGAAYVLLLAWGLWATENRVAAPIRRIGEAARRMGEGDFSLRAREDGLFDELRDVAATFNAMSQRLHDSLTHLEIERSFSATLLDRLPAGVAVIDTRREVMFANGVFAEFFGVRVPLKSRRPLKELAPIAGLQAVVDRAVEERTSVHTIHVRHAAFGCPDPAHLRISARAIYSSPLAPERVLLIFEDETREVLAAQQKQEWQDMLIHDVKSPLTAVVSSIRMLLQGDVEVSEDVRRLLDLADNSAAKITEMLETYLEVLRMEAGGLEPHRANVRLAEIAAQAAAAVRSSAEMRGVTIEVDVPGNLELAADKELLRRLLVNLLDNGINYARGGKRVGVRAARKKGAVRFEVWDLGPGIPQEDLPHVFDRFYRARRNGGAQGTGLGLAFCKLAADLHGWGIEVLSKAGRGTTVVVTAKTSAPAPIR